MWGGCPWRRARRTTAIATGELHAVVVNNVNITQININVRNYAYANRAIVVNQNNFYRVNNYKNVRMTNINRTTIINNYRAAPVVNNTVINNYTTKLGVIMTRQKR